MPKLIDITGRTFGRLTAISHERAFSHGRMKVYWLCVCECGGSARLTGDQLRRGVVQSCGCLQRERTAAANRTHGLSGTRLYNQWHHMVRRCYDPSLRSYRDYGGRGIVVCERWRDSFAAFVADMGDPPTRHHTIERVDNSGNYEPANCRWATRQEQNNNTRRNHLVSYQGVTRTISEWAKAIGIRPALLQARLSRLGWPVSRALTEPPNPRRQAAKLRLPPTQPSHTQE